MAKIRWDPLNPIAPVTSLAGMANDNFNQGIGAIANSIRGFAQDAKDQNTNALIREAMGIQNLGDLEGGRNTIMSMAQSAGNGADTLKALDALSKQEASLYARQNNINALAKHDRDLVREQGLDADRVLMNNPALIGQLMDGKAEALQSLPKFFDGTNLINSYAKGRSEAKGDVRYNQERSDRLAQQKISNNLAFEDQSMQLSKYLNPDPGTSTETWEDDGKGGFVQTTTTSPSAADTLSAVIGNRRADGSINWGKVGNKTGSPSASGKSPIANAVNANLKTFANNMAPETAQAINKLGVRDNNVLAMMVIEGAGGGMKTDSGVAIGPMQLHKQYARDDAKRYGVKGDPLVSAEANIQTGMAKMKDLSNKFGGNSDAIAIGYNGGENAARVAYNAWQKAGGKGRVADYIPSTYQSNGKTKKYDVSQMRNHALKYESAVNALTASKASKSNQGAIASATAGSNIPNTLAKPATVAKAGFSMGSGAIQQAQQQLQSSLTGNQQSYNTAGRQAGSIANKNALELYLEDSGIKPGGSAWGSLTKDSQNTFNVLKNNPEYAKLNPLDQKSVLADTMKFVDKNQGWLLGLNPADGKIDGRANKQIQGLIDSKLSAFDEKNFTSLRSAAQSVIDKEAKRKGRTGPLPTLEQTMRMLNPTLYNSMRNKDKQVANPFQYSFKILIG